jgi:outer membrane lipoprotein-sorting protein
VYRSVLLMLLLASALLAACAPLRTRPIGAPVSQTFAEELIQDWSASAVRFTSLKGLAKVKLQAPGNSMNGTQVLIAEKPGHLRAETLSPFGAPLLLLASDGAKLGVSLPPQNVYYTGTASAENLGMFISLPLRPAALVEVLLYQPPLLEGWKEEAFTLTEGGWLLVRHGTLRRQELVFNLQRQLVEVSYFAQNDLVMKVNYAQFPEQGEPFPHAMNIVVPDSYATVSLEFTDLETNAVLRAGLFHLTPPPGAKVIYLTGE